MNNTLIKIALVFVISLLPASLLADDVRSEMNRIKLSEDYFYGEGASEMKDLAYDIAMADMLQFVNEAREEASKQLLSVSDLSSVVKELTYQNDGKYVYLVYLTEKEVMALTPKGRSQFLPPVANQSTTKNTGSNNYVIPNVVTESNNTQTQVQKKTEPTVQPTYQAALDDDVVENIKNQDSWIEIRGFLSRYKEKKIITQTGSTISLAEIPDDAHCLIFDEKYGMLAYLSPKTNNIRFNHKTKKSDSENNYPTYKVIVWYK